MGLFDNWATEEIDYDQIEIDHEEGTVSVTYGTDQSASKRAQATVQSALLARILTHTEHQNHLLERQNDLLERQNELLKEIE